MFLTLRPDIVNLMFEMTDSTELFDSEYELSKAGFAANEVNDALAFQKLKNEIIALRDKWDEYAKARAIAKDKKWFRHPGIDVRGPERRDDPFWTHMRRFYVYDPLPTLQTLNAPLLYSASLIRLRVSKRMCERSGKSWIRRERRDYTVKVYPNGAHNLMEVPPDNPNEYVRLKRFPPGSSKLWSTGQQRSFVGVHQ